MSYESRAHSPRPGPHETPEPARVSSEVATRWRRSVTTSIAFRLSTR